MGRAALWSKQKAESLKGACGHWLLRDRGRHQAAQAAGQLPWSESSQQRGLGRARDLVPPVTPSHPKGNHTEQLAAPWLCRGGQHGLYLSASLTFPSNLWCHGSDRDE